MRMTAIRKDNGLEVEIVKINFKDYNLQYHVGDPLGHGIAEISKFTEFKIIKDPVDVDPAQEV